MIKRNDDANAKRNTRVYFMLTAVLLVLFVGSFAIGRYAVPLREVIRILLSRVFRIEKTWTDAMESAVINIRLPRIILACLVGACLSAAGTAYQSIFRNPMASPDILGASSGACFGAALSILLGFSKTMIMITSFIASLLTVSLVYYIGSRIRNRDTVSIILSGIMVSSLVNAGTSYVKLVADPTDQLPAITYWLMGSLSGSKTDDLYKAFIPMALGLLTLFLLRWRINLLTVSEEEAMSMGIEPVRLRFAVIVSATFVTASAVAVSGMIGWVGLVIPHVCRKLSGNNCYYLVPSTMLAGASFMLLVDNISRNLLMTEIPIGILTAFIGAPFFIYLLSGKENI